MRFYLIAILTIFISHHLLGQNADELNKKSKVLLSTKDFNKAIPLLKLAAEGVSPEAQYNYGVSFQQGIEVSQNDSIANAWFLKSAKQGWKDAQYKVALSYAIGRGWTKNERQAFYWSLKCAAQDDPECMFNVINCYMEGFGTQKSIDSVLVWATRLALLNNPEDLNLSGRITSARANLAWMYQKGEYVPKNVEKSYMWFLIYNESKKDFSIIVQQQNIDNIKNLEKQLTVTEKTKAKNEAETLLNRKLRNIDNLYKQDL